MDKDKFIAIAYQKSNQAMVFALDGLINFIENSDMETIKNTNLSEMADNLAQIHLFGQIGNPIAVKRDYTMNRPADERVKNIQHLEKCLRGN